MKDGFDGIIKKASRMEKRLIIPMCIGGDLHVIAKAAGLGIVYPVFIGGKDMHREPLYKNISCEYINAGSSEESLAIATDMLRNNKADIIMQGGIDTSSFLSSILDSRVGPHPHRRASHVCVFFFPGRKTPVIITDTFIHDHPTLLEKQMIIENTVSLWNTLSRGIPKIAALAVLEYVNLKIHSTLDSAILSKMSERHQLGKAMVEGPLDIDCAISKTAAERKGVKSPVAGDTDIYLVHDVESGYLFAEHLVFIGGFICSGLVLGMSKPVIIDLPFMSDKGLLASIALAALTTETGKNND
jgi:phosphotransacetylase